jgi:hypothetical protein
VLWRYEVGAVLAKAERDGTISAAKSAEFLAVLRSFRVEIDYEGTDRVLTDVYGLAIGLRGTTRCTWNWRDGKTYHSRRWTRTWHGRAVPPAAASFN